MKKSLFLLIISLSMFISGFGQSFVWTDPIPVTDSISTNVNIGLPPLFGFGTDILFGVWEKTIDANTTALYGRNISSMEEPFIMLSQPNVQYRHPMVINWQNGDTLLAVIYETNQNGNWDIYYSKYLSNGTMSPSLPICNTAADEVNFKYQDSFGLVWEQDGAIKFMNYVIGGSPSTATTYNLDQVNCHHPVISTGYCEWEKVIGSDTAVMFSEFHSLTSSWTPSAQLFGGINKNLYCTNDFGAFLIWQSKVDSKWRIKNSQVYDQSFYYVNDFAGANNIEPNLIPVPLVTKGMSPALPSFLSFASDVTGNYEIYVNHDIFDTVYYNISNHATINRHPQFFATMSYLYGYYSAFLFWESWRNNNWQIWVSHIDVPEGIRENGPAGSIILDNYPNPFTGTTTIQYKIAKEGYSSIEIFNTLGKKIRTLKEGSDSQGTHSIVWDGNDADGNRLLPGIYICTLRINDNLIQRKIAVL
jgi:hypothetical protein